MDILADVSDQFSNNSSAGWWVGFGALAFLAICKLGFVSRFCMPCNVLKIALGRVGKAMDV